MILPLNLFLKIILILTVNQYISNSHINISTYPRYSQLYINVSINIYLMIKIVKEGIQPLNFNYNLIPRALDVIMGVKNNKEINDLIIIDIKISFLNPHASQKNLLLKGSLIYYSILKSVLFAINYSRMVFFFNFFYNALITDDLNKNNL